MAGWFDRLTTSAASVANTSRPEKVIDTNWIGKRLSIGDYRTVANYLGMFQFDDPKAQYEVNKQIRALNEYGSLMNAVVNKAGPEGREQVAHFFQKHFNGVDSGNAYTKAYLDHINSIGDGKGKKAVYIDYVFDTNDSYKQFVDALGGEPPTIQPNGQKSGAYIQDGKHVFRAYKEQFGDREFFATLNKALNASTSTETTYLPTIMGGGSRTSIISGYVSNGYDADGKKISEKRGTFDHQITADEMNKASEELVKGLMSQVGKEEIPSELMVKGYMCKAERDVTNAVLSGQLETSVGNFAMSRIKDYYDRMFAGTSLTNFSVYSTEPGSDTQNLKEITKSEDKSALTDEVRAAIQEKRATFSAASAGGKVGTVITINPRLDKDGNPQGNMRQSRQIFVPGLFQEDAEEVMGEDPEAAVLFKRAQRTALSYDYELTNGGALTNFQSDGSATLKRNGIEVGLDSDEVHSLMLENETVRAAADELSTVRYTNNLDDESLQSLVAESAAKIYYYFNPTDVDASNAEAKKQIENRIQMYVEAILKNMM